VKNLSPYVADKYEGKRMAVLSIPYGQESQATDLNRNRFSRYPGTYADKSATWGNSEKQFNAAHGVSGEASNSTLPSLKSRTYLALNPSLNRTAKSSEGFLAVAS
jgi:hypothetical protein